ncbi:plasmid stabilization protein [candidate division LCP-89 bacterium B3_LCP]|uniref:Plasmid stabilization protein n=1 Tax=candidate division LCP-89 bacterium B3_LCP TaxID=2012998 RepID=A0A532V680_UNCL8|nr:MAG: plasmid stabilization protein [candidate division LCP-89 bacterium B3_LCP]
MSLKVIKTQNDYDEALREIEEFIILDPVPGTEEANRLEVLSVLIKAYEDEHFHFDLPDPISAIKFVMEQRGLKRSDLVPFIGSPSKVSEILSGKRQLSLSMMRRLNEGLNIPAEVLMKERQKEIPEETDIQWSKFPLTELSKRNWFPEFSGTLPKLKEYAEDLMRPKIELLLKNCTMIPLQRTSSINLRSDKVIDLYSLVAWQTRVVEKAKGISLEVPYSGKIAKALLKQIASLTVLDEGPLAAREILYKNGIHLVVEPHLKSTYLDGAVMLLNDGTPIIALTLRYNRLDNFWFSLIHELVHLHKHLDEENSYFFDDFEGTENLLEIEVEADKHAGEILIPKSSWSIERSIYYSTRGTFDEIKQLARKLNVHPAVLVGRIHHDSGDFRRYHRLLGKGIPQELFSDSSVNYLIRQPNIINNRKGTKMGRMRKTIRYKLYDGRKDVYHGITKNLERREQEHERDGKKFSRVERVGPAVTVETAKQWEEQSLKSYRKNHGGKNPKYNEDKTG